MDLKAFFKNVFEQQEKANVPVVQEIIERDDYFLTSYNNWKSRKAYLEWNETLFREMNAFRDRGEKHRDIWFMNSGATAALLWKRSGQGVLFYFDYLKERVLSLGYRSYMSDRKSYVRKGYAEYIERHYLKPKLHFQQGATKVEQLYGNITIECIKHNDEVQQLKFMCTNYRDHNYSEALDFYDLMERVLEQGDLA